MNESQAIMQAGKILSTDNWSMNEIKDFAHEAQAHARREQDNTGKSERELVVEYLEGFAVGA